MNKPVYAIGYARVSSPKQAQEGEGWEDQGKAIKHFVQQKGWTLYPDEILEEQFTGSSEDRPLYNYALTLIKKNPGKVKFFVVKVLDRFSRGGSEIYQKMKRELADLGVELRDVGGVIQPTVNSLEHTGFSYPWSKSSPSLITEVVLAESGRDEKSRILTRMVGASIGLTQKGYQIGPPNDGYLNDFVEIDGKKKCVLKPDPDRARFFKEMFKLRAEGVYSDLEIVERINKMGYRSKKQKRWSGNRKKLLGYSTPVKLTVKQLQKIRELYRTLP